ncbi:MAG: hypothetical protein ACRD6I_01860 [Candidatus Acidiferrales bacterium]
MKGITIRAAVCAVCVFACAFAAELLADELKLKDGSKISGRIVGFEGESFKVETSYGFALVRRDQVVSINVSDDKSNAAKTGSSTEATKMQASKAEARSASGSSGESATSAASSPAGPLRSQSSQETQRSAAPASNVAANSPPPEPANRESVEGTSYINHTYGFSMYKPPSWRVIEGAQRLLPSALVAMGTSDERTLMVLGRTRGPDASGRGAGALDAHVSATDQQLRQVYGNYRVLDDQRSVIAGVPAIERRFRGTVDERDWSCVLVSFARGGGIYTILGMTAADSDLMQIQENVIARALASLEFTP